MVPFAFAQMYHLGNTTMLGVHLWRGNTTINQHSFPAPNRQKWVILHKCEQEHKPAGKRVWPPGWLRPTQMARGRVELILRRSLGRGTYTSGASPAPLGRQRGGPGAQLASPAGPEWHRQGGRGGPEGPHLEGMADMDCAEYRRRGGTSGEERRGSGRRDTPLGGV